VPALGFDRIEMLNLTLGRLRFVDLARPEATREVDLGIRNQAYPNVKSQEELYGLAVVLLLQCGPELREQFSGQLRGLAADGAGKLKAAKEKAGALLQQTP
jgi:hypothetical protein